MIEIKKNKTQDLIDRISHSAPKVNYVKDEMLTKALLYLENNGFPNNKHEEYKYCNIDAILSKEFKVIEQNFISPFEPEKFRIENTFRIVVLNGKYDKNRSDKFSEKEITLKSFSELNEIEKNILGSLLNPNSDAFMALGIAFSEDGFVLQVDENFNSKIDIHVLYISNSNDEAVINSRNLFVLNKNSKINLIEEHLNLGTGKIFSNYVSEKILHNNSEFHSTTIQNQGEQGFSVNTQEIKVEENAKYFHTNITLSGQLVRNNHAVRITGENSHAELNGLLITKDNQLVDNHTLIDHQVPNCTSSELYKAIINDKSTGVFNGKIFVRKDAQKTNAYQSSKSILLSDDATANTKPQLEIYANDVKCSHGTSTGKLDENALFYLNSRGIGEGHAKRLLLNAYANEIIEKIPHPELKEKITILFENTID